MLRGMLLLLNLTGAPRLMTRLMLDRRVPLGLKLIPPAAILYIISPIDIVPDMLPALGRIDDVLVLLISLAFFLGTAPREVVAEHMRKGRPGASAQRREPRPNQTVIEGKFRVVDDE